MFDERSQVALYRLMNHGVIARLGPADPARYGKDPKKRGEVRFDRILVRWLVGVLLL